MVRKKVEVSKNKVYSIEGMTTAKQIVPYVKTAMAEKKLGTEEIREFVSEAQRLYGFALVEFAQDYIDMLNNMNRQTECKVSYVCPS